MSLSKLILLLFVGQLFLATSCNANPVSGTYIQKFKDAVLFIQIIAAPDGRVSGGGEFVSILPDGSLKDKSFSLNGSLDGDQINLKITVFLGWGPTFSGTVDGETLHLTSDKGEVTLVKSDFSTFAQEKSELAASGAAIATANKQAKHEAEAKGFFDRLTSEGQALEINLAKLPQAETDADKSIAQIKQRRDNIVSQIKVLRTKLQFISSDDAGEVESDIGGLISDLGGLRSDFEASIYSGAAEYDRLQSSLKNFKSHCDQWMEKYLSTMPPRCKNLHNYLVSYQSSRKNMKQKYDDAGKMFVFNKR